MLSYDGQDDAGASICIGSDDSVISLLNSIACDELDLANALHAEVEQIRSMLRKMKDKKAAFSVKELVDINRSVEEKMRNIIKNEILLHFKLENAMGLHSKNPSGDQCL